MKSTINYEDPLSVIQIAPRSGVFAGSNFDKVGFVNIVLGKWYREPENCLERASESHKEAAEQLYHFYLKYRIKADQGCGGLLTVLGVLGVTGSISRAEKTLKVADAHGLFIYDKSTFGTFPRAFSKNSVNKVNVSDPYNCSLLADLLEAANGACKVTNKNFCAVWVDEGQEFSESDICLVADNVGISRLSISTALHQYQLKHASLKA